MRLPTLQKTPALQPHELTDVTAQAVADLMREGESQNTQASYSSALRYWAAWFGIRYGVQISLPLPSSCVLQFIVDHAQRMTPKGLTHELPAEIDAVLVDAGYKGKLGPLAHNTLVHRLAVLSKAHQVREVKNPCQEDVIDVTIFGAHINEQLSRLLSLVDHLHEEALAGWLLSSVLSSVPVRNRNDVRLRLVLI